MKIQRFEALGGISIPLEDNQIFIDAGYTKSIISKAREIIGLHSPQDLKEWIQMHRDKKDKPKTYEGICLPFLESKYLPIHAGWKYELPADTIAITYRPQENKLKDQMVRAHEETHAIDFFGKMDLLEEKIGRLFTLKRKIRDYESLEDRANIGAVYAALKTNPLITFKELNGIFRSSQDCGEFEQFLREAYQL